MSKSIWMAVAAASTAGAGSAMESQVKSPQIAPARDGDIAIQEELCAARKKGTPAAYDLFIARHPGHRLVEVAKKERALLAASPRPQP
jgi:hypothetical protein